MKIITENLVETSHTVRAKAQEFDATASDLNIEDAGAGGTGGWHRDFGAEYNSDMSETFSVR